MTGTSDTRITLDYDLKGAAKQAAKEHGMTFRQYVEQSLRNTLAEPGVKGLRPRPEREE